jgi:hypothetical protein
MLKKIVSVAVFAAVLMFSGCSGDGDGESRLDAQNELDKGNYEKVISMLEPTDASTTPEEYNLLASAYMGKAGFTLADIVQLMDESSDSNSDGFAAFSSSIAKAKSSTALQDLDKASDYYDMVLGSKTCTDISLTSTQKDICFFKGLSALVKTGTTLSYLGDLTNFGSGEGSDDKLTASTCAMNYALDGTYDNTKCTLTTGSDVTFTVTEKTYNAFSMSVNGTPYYYLQTIGKTPDSTIITDGYCKVDFTSCATPNNTDCYACPVNQTKGEEDIAITTVLLDLLNNDVDAIGAAGGDDTTQDVEEFKRDVGGADGVITEQELIDYLEEENN